jgi:hypothetical protein
MGPQGEGDLILPVIDDFQEPTRFIAVVFWMRGALHKKSGLLSDLAVSEDCLSSFVTEKEAK